MTKLDNTSITDDGIFKEYSGNNNNIETIPLIDIINFTNAKID